ncbi:hypothetical protein R3P38DRAFT_2809491 [Favolaschia claudopus]|uniref:Uncharacterized protein n=1 Tax=Favolaschia claudopus TaxID=2862362 RepID=A0AAV9ZCY5_9AGAR
MTALPRKYKSHIHAIYLGKVKSLKTVFQHFNASTVSWKEVVKFVYAPRLIRVGVEDLSQKLNSRTNIEVLSATGRRNFELLACKKGSDSTYLAGGRGSERNSPGNQRSGIGEFPEIFCFWDFLWTDTSSKVLENFEIKYYVHSGFFKGKACSKDLAGMVSAGHAEGRAVGMYSTRWIAALTVEPMSPTPRTSRTFFFRTLAYIRDIMEFFPVQQSVKQEFGGHRQTKYGVNIAAS